MRRHRLLDCIAEQVLLGMLFRYKATFDREAKTRDYRFRAGFAASIGWRWRQMRKHKIVILEAN